MPKLAWLENALEDLTPKAETKLIKLLDNPGLQRGAERFIDGLSEEAKDQLSDLVQNALDHISSPALKNKLTEFAGNVGIDLTPDPIVHNSTTGHDVFTGTPGVVDYFVFNTDQPNPDPFNSPWDQIFGFEENVDKVVLTHFGEADETVGRRVGPTEPPDADGALRYINVDPETGVHVSTDVIVLVDTPINIVNTSSLLTVPDDFII
jgi:hypothetical protein